MPASPWDWLNSMPVGRPFEVYHLRHETWKNSVMHSHAYWEFYLFIQGSVEIVAMDRLYRVEPWDLMLFPAGVMHKNSPLGENANYERAYAYATEGFIQSVSDPACNLTDLLNQAAEKRLVHFHLTPEAGGELLGQMRGVIELAGDDTPVGTLIRRSRMTIFLATVCGIIQHAAAGVTASVMTKPAQYLRYIDQHFTEQLSLDDLAGRFYISKYHLLREFRDFTGTTIHQYLIRKRIVHAQLLLQRGMSAAEVVSACGFSDYTGFYRAFKKLSGVSPHQYAKIWADREE